MPDNKILTFAASNLPRLLATAIICLLVGANTHVTAANTVPHFKDETLAGKNFSPEGTDDTLTQKAQVLSPKDASLYRAAFAAQAKADWADADLAIANLDDKKLLGHVLADRYQRRATTAEELHKWLAAYSDLPEASLFYGKLSHIQDNSTRVSAPSFSSGWAAGAEDGPASGFKSDNNDSARSAQDRRLISKIDRALRHGDTASAKAILATEQKHRALTSTEFAEAASRIAAGLFYDGENQEARTMADEAMFGHDPLKQNPLALWIAGMSAWRQGDINAAGKFFQRLATASDLDPGDRAAASFWAYRAMKHQGDTTLARYWLEQTAKQPKSFYGILATHLLGNNEIKQWQLPELNTKNIATLSSRPAGWRAIALLQVGRPDLAESELRHLNPQNNRDLQEAMLAIAEAGQLPTLAMKLGSITSTNKGQRYQAALYPVPPWKPEQGFQIDRALMYALMRHESGFNPVAMSERGACGVMQLMPATASLMANDDKVGESCSGRLLNPSYNMALGQKYVRQLADHPMIGDSLLLILAAYNSGPGNLSHWIDDDATRKDPLLFIESLPVHETRDYVQQVMIHYWNYCSRLSEPQTSLAQLAHGEWPHANLRNISAAPPAAHLKQQRVMSDAIKVASVER